MDVKELKKISITREQIREVYDRGPEAVEDLVLSLVDSINYLIDIVKDQEKKILKQEERIKNLEDLINKNSRNSNKPPSSDSPFKNTQVKKNKKKGEQKKRSGTTLKQVSDPDEIIFCRVNVCNHCQTDLSVITPLKMDKRQVIDLPMVQAVVTEYQGEIKVCPCCHETIKPSFPGGVTHKIQYGSGIQALVVYLRNYQLLPTERTIKLLKDLFRISLSEGTLVNMTSRCAEKLSGFMENIKSKLIKAPVIHNDETGINIAGKLNWLHTTGNEKMTHLYPHKKRGEEAVNEIGILPRYRGVSVHDFWKVYEKYDCSHAYCNAHIIRELIFVSEYLKQDWASRLLELLLKIKNKVDESETKYLSEEVSGKFMREYEKLLNQACKVNPPPEKSGKKGRTKRGKVLCLIDRLKDNKDDVLRFMTNAEVPFDNNLAERDLRMVKVRQKISGTFRNMDRANDYCRIRSFISTICKHEKNVFEACVKVFSADFESWASFI